MATKQNPAEAAPHKGESGVHNHGGTVNQERTFRDFISFFASLVGLVAFGLSILPASTIMEKFLVIIAAFALSCAITLAVRLIPWSRSTAWLAVSSAVGMVSLAALSVFAQQDARSTLAAIGGPSTSGVSGTTIPETHSALDPTTNAPSSGQTQTSAPPSQQSPYTLDYNKTNFEMPGDNCQYTNTDFASSVTFTQQSAKVTVVTDINGGGGGDIDIACDVGNPPTLRFNEQAARMTGAPSPSQCASEITTHPISGSVPFQQLQPGSEYCFVAGGESATGPLVLATVKTVTGSPTFTTTWTATAWNLPPTS